MTLKSLNNRYMQLIRKIAVIGLGLLLAVSLLSVTPAATGVNITKTFLDEQKLIASDGAPADLFGEVVAVSGSTLVVSARVDDNSRGAAYVFNRQGGSWVEVQKLTASDRAAGDRFSNAIAVSGSTIVVGASFDDIGSNVNQGAAYVFERQGGSWVETQKLIASDGARGDLFAEEVAVSGSTIVVSAISKAVYVFERQGGSWVETQQLTASDGTADDAFGASIGISASTIVVGAPSDDIGGNIAQGSAYIFERQGGSWVETQQLTASDGEPRDNFGRPVAISGSTIVVGIPFDFIGGNFAQGSAYVFNRQGGGWVETQKLTASDGVSSDLFGLSVAVSNSTIVVGAPLDDVGGIRDQGSAYVFERDGGSWVEAQKLTASDGTLNDDFGQSVAVSGSTIVVGTLFATVGSNIGQGAAYVFEP